MSACHVIMSCNIKL